MAQLNARVHRGCRARLQGQGSARVGALGRLGWRAFFWFYLVWSYYNGCHYTTTPTILLDYSSAYLFYPLGLDDLEGGAVGEVKADDGGARAAAIEAREAVEALLVGRATVCGASKLSHGELLRGAAVVEP